MVSVNLVRTSLFIESLYCQLVAVEHVIELSYESLGVSFFISLVVIENVNIIAIAAPINFHGLQKVDKFFEIGLPIDSNYIGKSHCSSFQILKLHCY